MKDCYLWLFVLFLFLFICLCMIVSGCAAEQKKAPIPDTIEEGKVMVLVETARTEAKAKYDSMATMDKVKVACLIGFCLSIAIIALKQRVIGTAGLLSCGGGFCLAYAGTEYAKYLGIAGLVVSLLGIFYACFIIWRALTQVVKGGEEFKKRIPVLQQVNATKTFDDAHREAQKKTPATTKLVKSIKKNLEKKGK